MEHLIVILAVVSACMAQNGPHPRKEFACPAPNGGGLQAAFSELIYTEEDFRCVGSDIMQEIMYVLNGHYTNLTETPEYIDLKNGFCEAYVDLDPYMEGLINTFHDRPGSLSLTKDNSKYREELYRCFKEIEMTANYKKNYDLLVNQTRNDPYAMRGAWLIASPKVQKLIYRFLQHPQTAHILEKLQELGLTFVDFYNVYLWFFLSYFNTVWKMAE